MANWAAISLNGPSTFDGSFEPTVNPMEWIWGPGKKWPEIKWATGSFFIPTSEVMAPTYNLQLVFGTHFVAKMCFLVARG